MLIEGNFSVVLADGESYLPEKASLDAQILISLRLAVCNYFLSNNLAQLI